MKPLELKRNITRGVCAAKHCGKKVTHRKLCSTHRSQRARLADPVRYAYLNLKHNAKKRNILFTITLEQFREWCRKVEYIGFKGRSADSWTIDRKHNDIGYHADNIQVMSKSDNVKKYFSYDWRYKTAVVTSAATAEPAEDLQF